MPSIKSQLDILNALSQTNDGITLLVRLLNRAHDELDKQYWKVYSEGNTLLPDISNVAIFDMRWINEHYPSLKIDNSYPNIYIMRKNIVEFIAFEITADETSILHAIINSKGHVFSCQIEDLTDDPQLQDDVKSVYQNLITRLESMNQPFKLDNIRNGFINLPLPSENTRLYQSQLKYISKQGIKIEIPLWSPSQYGDVARRIRKLDMYKDGSGAFLGVNGDLKIDYPRWEILNVLERSEYEDRIIGKVYIKLPHLYIHLTVIYRDKFQDTGAGSIVLMTYNNANYQVNINAEGRFVGATIFEGEINIESYPILKTDDINKICDIWWDGLRLNPLWEHLLFIVDTRYNDISLPLIKDMLSNWLHLVE